MKLQRDLERYPAEGARREETPVDEEGVIDTQPPGSPPPSAADDATQNDVPLVEIY